MSAVLKNAKSEVQSKDSELSKMTRQVAAEAKKAKEAAASYKCKCESLRTENKKLWSHVNKIKRKLGTVTIALNDMATKEELIVKAASNTWRPWTLGRIMRKASVSSYIQPWESVGGGHGLGGWHRKGYGGAGCLHWER
jgi:hypothetical protein